MFRPHFEVPQVQPQFRFPLLQPRCKMPLRPQKMVHPYQSPFTPSVVQPKFDIGCNRPDFGIPTFKPQYKTPLYQFEAPKVHPRYGPRPHRPQFDGVVPSQPRCRVPPFRFGVPQHQQRFQPPLVNPRFQGPVGESLFMRPAMEMQDKTRALETRVAEWKVRVTIEQCRQNRNETLCYDMSCIISWRVQVIHGFFPHANSSDSIHDQALHENPFGQALSHHINNW